MANGVLSVRDVEDIQLAAEGRKPVHPHIQALKKATLPAIVEYGCLRWSHHELNLPDLPDVIATSPLGTALRQVTSELGLRTGGRDSTRWDRMDPRAYGFCTLHDETHLESQRWKRFEMVYERSSVKAGFPQRVATQLSVALHEMAANASTHACPPVPVLVGFHVRDGLSLFTVADVGIGVYTSLRKHPAYANIDTHAKAIRLALHDGVSSIEPGQRGWGFREVFKAILACDGMLRFRSGGGCVEMNGADLDADRGTESFPPQMPGFQVSVCCRRIMSKLG